MQGYSQAKQTDVQKFKQNYLSSVFTFALQSLQQHFCLVDSG